MTQLVKYYIGPWTAGTGVGYALLANHKELASGTAREIDVMASHAWNENAEQFFSSLERTLAEDDVMYICALSNYQHDDGYGPSIAQQLGSKAQDSPFYKVLKNIQRQGVLSSGHLLFGGRGHETVLQTGKHQGKTYGFVWKNDRDYCKKVIGKQNASEFEMELDDTTPVHLDRKEDAAYGDGEAESVVSESAYEVSTEIDATYPSNDNSIHDFASWLQQADDKVDQHSDVKRLSGWRILVWLHKERLELVPSICFLIALMLWCAAPIGQGCVATWDDCRQLDTEGGRYVEQLLYGTWKSKDVSSIYHFWLSMSFLMLLVSVLSYFMLRCVKLQAYDGRMVAVPCQEDDLYTRLWW